MELAGPDAYHATAARLPAEVLTTVFEQTDVYTATRARAASSDLRQPAAAAVSGVLAETGDVPAEAFDVFNAATIVHARNETVKHRDDHTSGDAKQYLTNLTRLMGKLPPRIEDIRIQPASEQRQDPVCNVSSKDAHTFAVALASSSCSSNVTNLSLLEPVATSAANIILQGLPSLRSLTLAIARDDIHSEAPAGSREQMQQDGAALQVVDDAHHDAGVDDHQPLLLPGFGHVVLDDDDHDDDEVVQDEGEGWLDDPLANGDIPWCPAASLSGLQLLQHMHIICCPEIVPDLAFLSSTTQLTQLHIESLAVAGVAALSKLQDLQQLHLPHYVAWFDRWPLLARLPKLQSLTLESAHIDDRAPAASALTKLVTKQVWWYDSGTDDEVLPSFLVAKLPNLQELHAREQQLYELVEVLHGHSALQVLHVQLASHIAQRPPSSPAQQLSSLAQLRELKVDMYVGDVSVLLRAAAGCSRLQRLLVNQDGGDLPVRDVALPGADVAALVSGPCWDSLREVCVSTGGQQVLAVDDVMKLVAAQGAGGLLRSVQVEVEMGVDVAEVAWLCVRSSCRVEGPRLGAGGRWYAVYRMQVE